jgi:hypothetical protein
VNVAIVIEIEGGFVTALVLVCYENGNMRRRERNEL